MPFWMLADGAFDALIPHALTNGEGKKEESGLVLFLELGPTSNRDGGDC